MIDLLLLIPLGLLLITSLRLIVTDFREHRLPNRITIPLIAITYLVITAHALSTWQFDALMFALIAGLITFGVGYAMAATLDFGMGDVKLLVTLNALLAWHSPFLVLVSLAIGFVVASVWATVVWVKTKDPKARIALGPYLLLGFAIAIAQPSMNLVTVAGGS